MVNESLNIEKIGHADLSATQSYYFYASIHTSRGNSLKGISNISTKLLFFISKYCFCSAQAVLDFK